MAKLKSKKAVDNPQQVVIFLPNTEEEPVKITLQKMALDASSPFRHFIENILINAAKQSKYYPKQKT